MFGVSDARRQVSHALIYTVIKKMQVLEILIRKSCNIFHDTNIYFINILGNIDDNMKINFELE